MEPEPITQQKSLFKTINQQSNSHKVKFQSRAAPQLLERGLSSIFVALKDHSIMSICPQSLNPKQSINTNHSRKISAIKQIQHGSAIATAAFDGTVAIWDLKNNSLIHQFNKPGAQFTAMDVSQHIMAAGYSDKIQFMDLRKMKQRGQFKQSFNGEISYLKFGSEHSTDLMACSADGMVNKFDLKEPNEQDAFEWGHRIRQSPVWLQFKGYDTLIRTSQQNLLRLRDAQEAGKLDLNNAQQPKHILYSQLMEDCSIRYIVRNPLQHIIESYVNNQCVGYINETYDVQFLYPLSDQFIFFCSEEGHFYCEKVSQYKKSSSINPNFNADIASKKIFSGNTAILNPLFASTESFPQNTEQSTLGAQKSTKGGYIVEKPSILKGNKFKKFKPY